MDDGDSEHVALTTATLAQTSDITQSPFHCQYFRALVPFRFRIYNDAVMPCTVCMPEFHKSQNVADNMYDYKKEFYSDCKSF